MLYPYRSILLRPMIIFPSTGVSLLATTPRDRLQPQLSGRSTWECAVSVARRGGRNLEFASRELSRTQGSWVLPLDILDRTRIVYDCWTTYKPKWLTNGPHPVRQVDRRPLHIMVLIPRIR